MTDLFTFAASRPYPATPGSKGTDTSAEAAKAISGRAGRLQAACVALLRKSPLTADEAAQRLNETVLAIRPRFSELRLKGQIVDGGERRPNASGKSAIVWKLTITP